MDEDGTTGFVLKISSFVIGLFKNSVCYDTSEICSNKVVASSEVKSQTFSLSKKIAKQNHL
jgi:hypothetical protein